MPRRGLSDGAARGAGDAGEWATGLARSSFVPPASAKSMATSDTGMVVMGRYLLIALGNIALVVGLFLILCVLFWYVPGWPWTGFAVAAAFAVLSSPNAIGLFLRRPTR